MRFEMMQCAPCGLNTDNYADIRWKGVVNATITTRNNILDIGQIFRDTMGAQIDLFVFHEG